MLFVDAAVIFFPSYHFHVLGSSASSHSTAQKCLSVFLLKKIVDSTEIVGVFSGLPQCYHLEAGKTNHDTPL